MALSGEEHKRRERAYADEHAPAYFHEMYQGPWPIYRARIEERLYQHAERFPRVLDVGCGPIPSLPTVFDEAQEYVAVDQSPRCIRMLRQAYPKARALEGDADELDVEGPFDLVIVFGVLHHLPAPQRAVRRTSELLRPGGLIVCTEPNPEAQPSMDSPCERGIPDQEFDHPFSAFAPLERWSWFDHAFWKEVVDRHPQQEQVRLWPRPEAWFAFIEEERERGLKGSMNVIIARRT